ncbi:MAG: polysaccharide deacetylase family protein [Eubacteriales bacterium]|nr:polysaccharide deacetylase family protein [Eubacteriales bacterium]
MKRKLTIALTVVLFLGLVVLYVAEKTVRRQNTEELVATNNTIQELENERAELEQQMDIVAGKQYATLCFNVADEQLYSSIYPLLKKQGIKGTIILRNNQLPGNKYAIPVQDFLNLMDAGWYSAISLSRSDGETDDEWKSHVEAYMQQLQERTGITPIIYCFPEGSCSAAEAEILEELGFETVLCHKFNDSLESSGLQFVKLYPYNAKTLNELLAKTDGYCGLEVWVDWVDSTQENLRYSKKNLKTLLESDTIQIQNLDSLRRQNSLDAEAAAGINAADVETRLAEIEAELEDLYQ